MARDLPPPFVTVQAVNPETIACDPALLVCALQTVGVLEHPRFPFRDVTETVDGKPRRTWTWFLHDASQCGTYRTAQLIKWWQDEQWHLLHPTHEFAIVKQSLKNFAEIAWRVKQHTPRARVRRGRLVAEIPANASPERKERLTAMVEGRLPFNAPFNPSSASPS